MSDLARPDSPGVMQFASLLEASQGALRGFVCGMVGSLEQAQDITQDVFVDAWRAATRGHAPFDGTGDIAAMRRWLFHVAYQRAVSALRRGALLRFESLDVRQPTPPARIHESAPFEERIAEGDALQAALDALEPQDAACVLLSVVQGFTAPEVAMILDISPVAAKKRLTRAKQRLRHAYLACQTQETTGQIGER
jgi:RNA polymerase sigma-70 factor (ECF subfamily)